MDRIKPGDAISADWYNSLLDKIQPIVGSTGISGPNGSGVYVPTEQLLVCEVTDVDKGIICNFIDGDYEVSDAPELDLFAFSDLNIGDKVYVYCNPASGKYEVLGSAGGGSGGGVSRNCLCGPFGYPGGVDGLPLSIIVSDPFTGEPVTLDVDTPGVYVSADIEFDCPPTEDD